MKIKKSIFAAVLALALSLGLVVGATANDKKQIVAYEDYTIAIKMDGEIAIPTDVNGNRVYPVTYNGTTYLPIRAVSKLVGLEVDWDQANQTVLLGKPSDGVDLIDTYKYYYQSFSGSKQYQTADKQTTTISGINCSHWTEVRFGSWWNKGDTSHVSYNIEGKYKTLTFQYYAEKDTKLRVLGDNDYLLFEADVKGGQLAKTATVDLLATSQLTFLGEDTGNDYFSIYIFDAKLK